MRLEGYRLERHGKVLAARIALISAAGVLILLGAIFASLGAAGLLGDLLHSRPAGLAIVGGVEAFVGVAVIWYLGSRTGAKLERGTGS
jgi:hypothetical protein